MREPGSDRGTARTAGRLSKTITSFFMKRATVAGIDDVADRFRLVILEGKALQNVLWIPGQKVQVAMGSAFVSRTYTPFDWDAALGRLRILGYIHGDGPGSSWLRGLKIGDECDLFGPRNSIDARHLGGPLAIFGDETSIGLSYALSRQNPARSVFSYFDVEDMASAEWVGTTLALGNVALFRRSMDDEHPAQMDGALPGLVRDGASFVLTGRAGTVQRLRHHLKRQGIASNRIATKAYWAPGKTGLD